MKGDRSGPGVFAGMATAVGLEGVEEWRDRVDVVWPNPARLLAAKIDGRPGALAATRLTSEVRTNEYETREVQLLRGVYIVRSNELCYSIRDGPACGNYVRGSGVAQAMADRSRETRGRLIEAARQVLTEHGYSGLSTRRVAEVAGMPMSQIRYHFGSKEGMILALYEYMNAALLDRQQALFADPALSLSQKWDRACDYLEVDLASGYVRIMQELIAAGWSDPTIRDLVRHGIDGWYALITGLASEAENRFGRFPPFEPGDFTALIGAAFLGAESQILLGRDNDPAPHRRALRRFGAVLRLLEETSKQGM